MEILCSFLKYVKYSRRKKSDIIEQKTGLITLRKLAWLSKYHKIEHWINQLSHEHYNKEIKYKNRN